MPELPDLTLYVDAINERLAGATLDDIRLTSPFLLRTVTPGVNDLRGKRLVRCHRLAKQLVFTLDDDYHCVLHLIISGRLQFSDAPGKIPKGRGLASFDFSTGSLLLTEASKKKRAALRLVHGEPALAELNPGGLEIFGLTNSEFRERLRQTNHTLKRALTDQRQFAGIGNAYSDEILLVAKLSPFKQSSKLTDEECDRLLKASQSVVSEWIVRLRSKAAGKFPRKVTAFHEEMLAHGKYRDPCGVCGSPIQRIVYAENEANYCAQCQTGGKLLADRSLSRLLKDSWPRTLEELENL